RLAQPGAPPSTAQHVGRLAHRLGPARQHRVGLAEKNAMRGLDDRLEPRAAEPIDDDRGSLDRQSGSQPDVPRQIRGVGRGLNHVAENDMLDVGRSEAGPGDGALCGQHSEVGGGVLLEGAAKAAEAGPDSGEKDDLLFALGSTHGMLRSGMRRAGRRDDMDPEYAPGGGGVQANRYGCATGGAHAAKCAPPSSLY